MNDQTQSSTGTLALDYLENAERFEFEVRRIVSAAAATEDALIALRTLRTVQTVYAVDTVSESVWCVTIMFTPGVTTQILCDRNQSTTSSVKE